MKINYKDTTSVQSRVFSRVVMIGDINMSIDELKNINSKMITDTNSVMNRLFVSRPTVVLSLDIVPELHMRLFRAYQHENRLSNTDAIIEFMKYVSDNTLEAYRNDTELVSLGNILIDSIDEVSVSHNNDTQDLKNHILYIIKEINSDVINRMIHDTIMIGVNK